MHQTIHIASLIPTADVKSGSVTFLGCKGPQKQFVIAHSIRPMRLEDAGFVVMCSPNGKIPELAFEFGEFKYIGGTF